MSDKVSVELADPALGNDIARARDLLFRGADISHDFYAAAQNAAANGNPDVLKLVLVADEVLLAARDDARRAATRAGHQDIDAMLARIDPAMASQQHKMQQSFVSAVKSGNKQEAALLLDQMVTLVFTPRP